MEYWLQVTRIGLYASMSLFLVVLSGAMLSDCVTKRPPLAERLGRYTVDKVVETVKAKDGAFVANLVKKLRPSEVKRNKRKRKNQQRQAELLERLGRYTVDTLLKTATAQEGKLIVGILRQVRENRAKTPLPARRNLALEKSMTTLGKHLIDKVLVLLEKDKGRFIENLLKTLRGKRTPRSARQRAAQQAAMRAVLKDVLTFAAKRIVDKGTANEAKLVIKVIKSLQLPQGERLKNKKRNQKGMQKMLGGVLKYAVARLLKSDALGGLLGDVRLLVKDARRKLWPSLIKAVSKAAERAIFQMEQNRLERKSTKRSKKAQLSDIQKRVRVLRDTVWAKTRAKFYCIKKKANWGNWAVVKSMTHLKIHLKWKKQCRTGTRCLRLKEQVRQYIKRQFSPSWKDLRLVEMATNCR
ncbi:MAG TPA: hypothetical protein DCE42_01760 [Myxococcales bacterium]|nr:hypothetical protein [Deltaproteobacteria bacterium]HAA53450.1 hypothetical protein [Myxococcales bacterium]|tara:strand:- start:343 stop:1575 length:1233 start_codon:yes stop_codon:yes gene_type:complete